MFAAVMALTFLCVTQDNIPATQPDPGQVERLIALAPHFNSKDREPTTFEFTCYAKQFGARIRVTKVNDRVSMLVEAIDGTPVLIAADRQALVYDALRGNLLYFKKAVPNFRMLQDGDRLILNFGISAFGDDKQAELELDCRSILEAEGVRYNVAAQPQGNILLVGLSQRGNPVVAEIDPVATVPYQRMRLMIQDERDPNLSVYGIRIGEAVDDNHLAFPDTETYLPLALIEVDPDDRAQTTAAVGAFLRSLAFRIAIHNEQARPEFERKVSQKLDWDALREADANTSRQLRSVPKRGAAAPIEQGE